MRSIASMMSFTLLAATSRATRVVPEEDVHETASRLFGLSEHSIAVYKLPKTFILRFDGRAPDTATSTIPGVAVTTGHEQPTSTTDLVVSALTTVVTVPITTSTLPSISHQPLPPQVSAIAPSACFDAICKQPVALSYPFAVSTVLAVWHADHPESQTLFDEILTASGQNIYFSTIPVGSVMASSVNPSSFSYSFIESTTQHFSPMISGAPGITALASVTLNDTLSGTHGPPPEITTTNSFSTTSNASTTEIVPATWSNNITSPIPTVTSVHVTTVDASSDSLPGTASSSATFPSQTNSAATSSGTTQSNDGESTHGGNVKHKMALLVAVAVVVNFGFAAMT